MTKEERIDVIVSHAFGGWHHVQSRKPNGSGVQFAFYGDVSTFDWDVMTRLLLACYAMRVRCEVRPNGPKMLKFFLHCRVNKPDSWSEHHPSLDDLIVEAQKLKASFPVETIIT